MKSIGFKNIKYDIPVHVMNVMKIMKVMNTRMLSDQRTQHVLYSLNAGGCSRISNMTFPCVMNVMKVMKVIKVMAHGTRQIINIILERPGFL